MEDIEQASMPQKLKVRRALTNGSHNVTVPFFAHSTVCVP